MTTDSISFHEGKGVKNFVFATDRSGTEFEIPNWLGRVTNDTDADCLEFQGRGSDNRIIEVVILDPSHPSAGEGRFRFADHSTQDIDEVLQVIADRPMSTPSDPAPVAPSI